MKKFEKRVAHRINGNIRAGSLRVIGEDGNNYGVITTVEAQKIADEQGVDLIEISPEADPPVAKIMEYGKFHYELAKKQKTSKAGSKATETKAVQIKIGTGDHDLELKAKNASKWLTEGHRIKAELYLSGRAKYMQEAFLKERLERILKLISVPYKIAEPLKKSPRGMALVIERDKK